MSHQLFLHKEKEFCPRSKIFPQTGRTKTTKPRQLLSRAKTERRVPLRVRNLGRSLFVGSTELFLECV